MAEEHQYCAYCGAELQPGFKFCERCGSPVEANSETISSRTAVSPSPVANIPSGNHPEITGKKRSWVIPVIGMGCVLMLCIGALIVGGIFYYYDDQQTKTASEDIPTQISEQMESESSESEEVQPEIPTDTPETIPDSTSTSTESEPETESETESEAAAVATATEKPVVVEEVSATTQDVLLDYSDHWDVVDNDQYRTDISQRGDWAIGVKQNDISVAVVTPNQATAGTENVIITMDTSTSAAGQIAGVRCQVQDEKNYYQVALKDKQFAIGKVVDGKLTPLTEPYWKDSQFIGSAGMPGGANISVTCQGSSIGISIEGMGEIPLISDPDNQFQSGRIALFAAPGEVMQDEFFSFVLFNNLTIDVIQ